MMGLRKTYILLSAIIVILAVSCGKVEAYSELDNLPNIFPNYVGVTVPEGIAPLNFSINDVPSACLNAVSGSKSINIKAKHGLFQFSRKEWNALVSASDVITLTITAECEGKLSSYKPFNIYVSRDPIDPYISYRLIPPGYQGWRSMGIYQRCLGNYAQEPVIENGSTNYNCLNCHSFPSRNPDKMLFHVRSDFGGTMLIQNGEIEKLDTKTDSTISALVYPYWHPSERYVVFSVNKTLQSFFNHDPNRIEVFDKASDVVVYDVTEHSLFWSPLTKSPDRYETFPTFSPDGKWLYFCSAEAVKDMPADYDKVKYSLVRISFNQDDCTFGDDVETVFDAPAIDRSVSFPRISPDGRFLAFTLHGYGNFSIWHKDADICLLDLQTGKVLEEPAMNSDDVDSYHSWSSNGRWMLFSSRRDDGLYTKLYIAHIDENGVASKPFLLPQKNPKKFYHELMFSYNIPEFMISGIPVPPKSLVKDVRGLKPKKISILSY